MKSNVWLATFGIISVLLIGGAAFFCLKAKSGYDEALDQWDLKLSQISTLSKKVPYPEKESEEKIQKQLDEYKAEVKVLFENLNQFQKPLNTTLRDVEFPQLVRKKVDDLIAKADAEGTTIENPEEFFMGFDAYKTEIPSPDMVPILDYELGAIDHLTNLLVDQDANAITSLTRDLLPGEGENAAKPEGQDASVTQKYPVRIGFNASHDSFQSFLNKITNDREYFYIVRVMQIKNENQDPPLKLTPLLLTETPKFTQKDTGEIASTDLLEESGWPDADFDDLAATMLQKGYVPSGEDARVLMGMENLDVFMVIDIVRFQDPEEVKPAEEEKPARRGPKRPE